MRKEREALVAGVDDRRHSTEMAMDAIMTEHAKLGVELLEARAAANLSPLIGAEVLAHHAAGHEALARYMSHVKSMHAAVRELGRFALPGVAIGDSDARPRPHAEIVPPPGPRLVAGGS